MLIGLLNLQLLHLHCYDGWQWMASCSNFWLISGCQLVLYCKTSKFVFCKILNTDNIVRLWISAIIILKEWSVVKQKRWQIACWLEASKSRIFKRRPWSSSSCLFWKTGRKFQSCMKRPKLEKFPFVQQIFTSIESLLVTGSM